MSSLATRKARVFYVEAREVVEPVALADRVLAMLFRLANPRR